MNVFRFLWGAAALGLLTPLVRANEPYHHAGYGGCAGGGCWAVPGCCERPISKADHIWDNYCQEKWCPCVHPANLRPYWHAPPAGAWSHSAAPAANGHGETYATPVSTDSVVTTKQAVSSRRAAPMPTPPQPPSLKEPTTDQPPSPPSTTADESLQLRLQPLSRPRPARP
jgi:hypothetical protein